MFRMPPGSEEPGLRLLDLHTLAAESEHRRGSAQRKGHEDHEHRRHRIAAHRAAADALGLGVKRDTPPPGSLHTLARRRIRALSQYQEFPLARVGGSLS